MAASVAAEALVADLSPLGEVTARRMFGGYGIFHESLMFGIVDPAGRCLLRADDATREAFESAGSERHARMPYWVIPTEVRASDGELVPWARRALDAARAARR